MERERGRGEPVLVLDTGGMFLEKPGEAQDGEIQQLKVETLLDGIARIGYDAAGIGPGDLALPEPLLERLAAGPVPFLAANLERSGRLPFAPVLVRRVAGRRIGIVGVVGAKGLPAGDRFTVREPLEPVRSAVAELRRSCDLVVVLSSLGVEGDVGLAEAIPGIDVILGGGSRIVTKAPRAAGSALIVHAGAKGMRLGRLELEVDPGSAGPWSDRGAVTVGPGRRYRWSAVSLSASIPDDPGLASLLEDFRERQRALHLEAEPPGADPPPGAPGAYTGAAACGSCHPSELAQWKASAHARALATLAARRQDANPGCLPCHVTAYGEPDGYRRGALPDLGGVQCESCHGFGREHRGPGRIRGSVSERVCRRCHTAENSPEFEYPRYLRALGEHAAGALGRSPG